MILERDSLKELISYDSETGIFTWSVNRGSNLIKGTEAGFIESHGYRAIKINNTR